MTTMITMLHIWKHQIPSKYELEHQHPHGWKHVASSCLAFWSLAFEEYALNNVHMDGKWHLPSSFSSLSSQLMEHTWYGHIDEELSFIRHLLLVHLDGKCNVIHFLISHSTYRGYEEWTSVWMIKSIVIRFLLLIPVYGT